MLCIFYCNKKKKIRGCQWLAEGKMDEQVEHTGFMGIETILYDISVVDTCYYTLDKIHSMYNTKNEP